MSIRSIAMVIIVVTILVSCVSTGTGGLVDLRSDETLSVEIELEEPAWDSPPELEILADNELIGYYTRSSKPGKLVDTATVLTPDRELLFTITSSLDDHGREVLIRDAENVEGRIRAAYSPSAPVFADIDLFGWPYAMKSGYARKAGAEGYRHRQWIITDEWGPAFILETKVWADDYRDAVAATAELASREDEILLFSTLSIVFMELDAADRAREAQERAAGQVMDEARKDSGFSIGGF